MIPDFMQVFTRVVVVIEQSYFMTFQNAIPFPSYRNSKKAVSPLASPGKKVPKSSLALLFTKILN